MIPRISAPRPWLLLLVLGALASGGCASKKSLDRNVDRLVTAVVKNDYDAFKAMSVPELVTQFSRERFLALSQALNSLGAFKERTMKGIQVKSGGVRQGKYTLRFAKGTVRLELTLHKGKLTAFFLKGDALMKAIRRVHQAKFSTFKATRFRWRDAKGTPKNNIYVVGKPVHFKVEVWGLKRAGKNLDLRADLRVLSGERVVLDRPGFVDKALPMPEDQPPVATVTGNLVVPAPGSYKLLLRLTDKVGNQSTTHAEAFVVEAAK